MKKNLISIVILALLVVNIVLSAITLFSVVGTNRKTASLVTNIAQAINLDLGTEAEEEAQISIADVVTYDMTEMTLALRVGEDGAAHYAVLDVTLSMNSKDKDYKEYGNDGDLSPRESLIKGKISDVISQYTVEEARVSGSVIEQQILEGIQALYDSKFIFDVTISGIYQ